MDKKYHYNPDTGKTGQCRAKIKCRFGMSADEHYATAEEASAAYGRTMKKSEVSTVRKPDPRDDPKSWGLGLLSNDFIYTPYHSLFFSQELSQRSERLASEGTDELDSAVSYYQRDGYEEINDALRSGGKPDDRAKLLKKAISILSDGSKRISYRGSSMTIKEIDNIKSGDTVRFPAFTSTSIYESIALRVFGGAERGRLIGKVNFEMIGRSGGYIGSSEGELLYPPNTEWVVLEKRVEETDDEKFVIVSLVEKDLYKSGDMPSRAELKRREDKMGELAAADEKAADAIDLWKKQLREKSGILTDRVRKQLNEQRDRAMFESHKKRLEASVV